MKLPRALPSADALGIYWKIEKAVRKLESASGSVVGVTGAIYAIRRELYTPIPQGTILDDVFIPMNVARMGKRVVFQPSAIARDRLFGRKGKGVLPQGSYLDRQLPVTASGALAALASEPPPLSLLQPQTAASRGPPVSGPHVDQFSSPPWDRSIEQSSGCRFCSIFWPPWEP